LLVATLLYVENKENFEEAKKCLGIVCCVVTILFFAAPLASLLHVIKMKNSESLPFPIIFASFVVSMQWLIYGYILKDTFIQVPIVDSSCKKPLCLCNSTFMALVIWNYFKIVLIWKVFNPNWFSGPFAHLFGSKILKKMLLQMTSVFFFQ
jgi:uncharacterized protein with PQ loop repeat